MLVEQADQVASLRAALSVSAAAEEARRGEVEGLQQQLRAFRQEEELRFRPSPTSWPVFSGQPSGKQGQSP